MYFAKPNWLLVLAIFSIVALLASLVYFGTVIGHNEASNEAPIIPLYTDTYEQALTTCITECVERTKR